MSDFSVVMYLYTNLFLRDNKCVINSIADIKKPNIPNRLYIAWMKLGDMNDIKNQKIHNFELQLIQKKVVEGVL